MTGMFRKIFVVYPRGVRTGGPEALHQLVSTLRTLGQDAYLVPRPGTESAERVSAYDHYGAPEVSEFEDASDNAVVTSEYIMTHLANVKKATRFCWWLSIDNSPVFKADRQALGLWETRAQKQVQTSKFRTISGLQSIRRSLNGQKRLIDSVNHLSQSEYAWSFLFTRLNVVSNMVSDYTPLTVLHAVQQLPPLERGRTIAFNPKKAARITELLKDNVKDAVFVPLVGMSPAGVASALGTTSIYLDLGYHPGKDRMPREAAICGAVSLVARRGSGAFYGDVPIPWEHKITADKHILQRSVAAIERVFLNPEGNQQTQAFYRDRILSEKETFQSEVERTFVFGEFDSNRA